MDESKIKQLLELRELKERGVLTAEEVETEKRKILADSVSVKNDRPTPAAGAESNAVNSKKEIIYEYFDDAEQKSRKNMNKYVVACRCRYCCRRGNCGCYHRVNRQIHR